MRRGAHMTLAGLVAATAVFALGASAPARAALPGRNGLIAAVVSTMRAQAAYRIVLLRPGGALVRRIACPSPCGDIWPAWSPRGTRLAFTAGFGRPPGGMRIGIAGVSGGGRRLLPAPGPDVDAVAPAWSPDGLLIAFGSVGFDRGGIDVADPRTGATRRLPLAGQEPAWSSTNRLAYAAGGPAQLFSARADGSHPRQLTRRGGLAPDWSPDGRRIVFERVAGGREEIWTVSSTGTDARRLGPGSLPTWSPDGRLIVFARAGRLRTIRPDGTHVRCLPTPWLARGQQLLMPAWQPLPRP
ncbi:MAG: TolB family protein [Solirubrobacteraceae bacterium]